MLRTISLVTNLGGLDPGMRIVEINTSAVWISRAKLASFDFTTVTLSF